MGTVEQRNGIWRLSLEQIVPFVKPERRDSAVYSTTTSFSLRCRHAKKAGQETLLSTGAFSCRHSVPQSTTPRSLMT
jgi:hypothetical protein